MVYLKVLAGVSLVGAIAWVLVDPGFEPGLAVLGSASALLGLFVTAKKKRSTSSQEQVVSGRSTGIQAGGDVSIGSPRRKDDA